MKLWDLGFYGEWFVALLDFVDIYFLMFRTLYVCGCDFSLLRFKLESRIRKGGLFVVTWTSSFFVGLRLSIRAVNGSSMDNLPLKKEIGEGSSENWKVKMLYDGECPLCMREVMPKSKWNFSLISGWNDDIWWLSDKVLILLVILKRILTLNHVFIRLICWERGMKDTGLSNSWT